MFLKKLLYCDGEQVKHLIVKYQREVDKDNQPPQRVLKSFSFEREPFFEAKGYGG